jgi:hypothetical protein
MLRICARIGKSCHHLAKASSRGVVDILVLSLAGIAWESRAGRVPDYAMDMENTYVSWCARCDDFNVAKMTVYLPHKLAIIPKDGVEKRRRHIDETRRRRKTMSTFLTMKKRYIPAHLSPFRTGQAPCFEDLSSSPLGF